MASKLITGGLFPSQLVRLLEENKETILQSKSIGGKCLNRVLVTRKLTKELTNGQMVTREMVARKRKCQQIREPAEQEKAIASYTSEVDGCRIVKN